MRVLYQHTAALVQKLQAARRDLALEAAIHKLHKYHLVILDDFSCVTCVRSGNSVPQNSGNYGRSGRADW